MVYRPTRDRVQERSTDEGSGDIKITAVTNMRRFIEAGKTASGDTMDYVIVFGGNFEIGIAPVAIEGSDHVLKRATGLVKSSSAGDGLVNFPAGVKDVFNDAPAHVLNAMLRGDIAQTFAAADRARMLASLGITNQVRRPGDLIVKIGVDADAGSVISNGALLSRVTFADLWSYANTRSRVVSEATWAANNWGCFSSGTDGTNFRIPLLLGEFMRFLDAGRGVDPGRLLGSFQDHQFQSHGHVAAAGDDTPDHSHLQAAAFISVVAEAGTFSRQVIGPTTTQGIGTYQPSTGGASNRHGHAITVSSPSSGNFGSETRGRNIALLPCLQYEGLPA